jgi:two-component system sensor histidine kinase EvgS
MDASHKPTTLMIVDDTPANLTLLQEILQARGYRVVAFTKGSMALKAAAQNPPDLILLDIRMPEMDGFEVCRRLKENGLLKKIPVLFISALTEAEDKIRAFSAGGVDYVTKPFESEEVYARVETHLRLKRLVDESEKRHEVLIQELPDLVLRFDPRGDLLFLSEKASEALEIHPRSCVDLSHRNLKFCDPADISWEKAIETVVRTGKSLETEYAFHGKDGPAIHNLRLVPEHNTQGKIISILALSRDITTQKHAEKMLIQAKEAAEAADLVKSEFLSNMSHELRTPLNGILGVMYLLQNTHLDIEDAKILHMGIAAAERLTRLLSDLIDFASLESGKIQIHQDAFELKSVCESVITLFALTAMEKDLALDFSMDPATPRILLGDAARLRQILFHLMGNALKFTTSGRVLLEIGPIRTKDPEKVRLLFTISDTGVGIPLERLRHIWDPFTQVDGSSTRSHDGTGLGLSLVRRLVHRMDGDIFMDSTQGQGTDVHMCLPFALP